MKIIATSIAAATFLFAGAAHAADGKAVFDGTCKTCHASGMMGAPKVGDKAAWGPRIAQGEKVLLDHALNGIRKMPARGGKKSLTDDEVKAAMQYMVGQSK